MMAFRANDMCKHVCSSAIKMGCVAFKDLVSAQQLFSPSLLSWLLFVFCQSSVPRMMTSVISSYL